MSTTVELRINGAVDTEETVKQLIANQYPGSKFISASLDRVNNVAHVTFRTAEELRVEKTVFK